MKKRSRTSSMVAELPCEIIHDDILTRLPVKSLLKFRCVCKSWCELIRTPRFVKMYSDQCKNDTKLMIISDPTKEDDEFTVYSLEFGEKMHHVNVVKIPFSSFQFHRILGSCNGLVLVYNYNYDEKDTMYLWNPWTREYKLVSTSPQTWTTRLEQQNKHGSGYKTRLEEEVRFKTHTYGFGYNAIAKDYEIIMICAYSANEPLYSIYSIYSLGKNSWGGFQNMSPYIVDSFGMGELVNDALHWEGPKKVSKSPSIVSFNIANRKFQEFPTPPTSEVRYSAIGITSINGCLSIGIHSRFGVEIWMMKDYGVKESWTQLIKYSRPSVNSNPRSSVSKCFAMNISKQNMGYHDMPTCTLELLLSKLGCGNKKAEQIIANSRSSTIYTETLVPL